MNYVVRPATGEIFPPASWDNLKNDLTLRIATDEEQTAIAAGLNIRTVNVPDPVTGAIPVGRFLETNLYFHETTPVGAMPQAKMDVALGKIPAPVPAVLAPEASPVSAEPGFGDITDAIEAKESIAELAELADAYDVVFAPTDSIDAIKARIKRAVIATVVGQAAPSILVQVAHVDQLTTEALASELERYGVVHRANASDATKRALLRVAIQESAKG